MSLCSLSASFIRAHKAVPGLSGARRNTRGFHSVNRGLAPNSAWHLISHARPEAASLSTRASSLSLLFVAVLVASLRLHTFPSLAVFILDCLFRLRWPSPLPRLQLRHSFSAPASLEHRSLPSLSVFDQRPGPPLHNGYSSPPHPPFASQRRTSPGRCACLLTSGLLTCPYLPIC